MTATPRLDVLLYAHDGRGLGHASRAIAIGLALRRLFPELRVLFLSGCRLSAELIGKAPLDWLKLPSYETVVKDGRSRGIDGKSNFSDDQLGLLRGRQIEDIVCLYRPRLVLADHSPQGKHRELLPALEKSAGQSRWVLGLRGVVGSVSQLRSSLAVSLFRRYYSDLLWYGDSAVLGCGQLEEAGRAFATSARECGYVSRLKELAAQQERPNSPLAGVISIPWIGENTPAFLDALHAALGELGHEQGDWEIYLDGDHSLSAVYRRRFEQLPRCTVHSPGQRYAGALLRARCAIIYGGYNSLVDVLSVPLPALVVAREMSDGEQHEHLEALLQASPGLLLPLSEACAASSLQQGIRQLLENTHPGRPEINLSGAETAARLLAALLED